VGEADGSRQFHPQVPADSLGGARGPLMLNPPGRLLILPGNEECGGIGKIMPPSVY
jgi:hypothetical protein